MKKNDPDIRWWDFPAAILLMAAVFTAATRLVSTHWTDYLSITQTLVLLGVIVGIALGKSIFSIPAAIMLGAAYGLFMIPWQLGLTLERGLLWRERMLILESRLSLVVQQLANHEPVQDSILFLLIMSILFWFLAVHAGFILVRRGSVWGSILPAGLTMFVIHAFDAGIVRRSGYLAAFLFFILVLVARMYYIRRQERWQSSRTALPPNLSLDFLRLAMVVTLFTLVLAWTAPALASALPPAKKIWQPIKNFWSETQDRFENVFASLHSSTGVVSRYYGISASLGSGSILTDEHILTIHLPDNLPANVRLYWQARAYDTYEAGQWYSTYNTTYQFNPRTDQLPVPDLTGRWSGTFTIMSAVQLSTLFIPPQPIWTDHAGQVEYVLNPDGSLDISTFRAIPYLEPGDFYQAKSLLDIANELQLKNAGENYPEWITRRYLALPDSVTPRIIQLAVDITKDYQTPYEKAVAITNYLRKNIQYVETIEDTLPDDQDLIDWFLFDYQKGFCNYYSTAEVILLRAVGIPARWAMGYAEGERSDHNETGKEGNRSSARIIVRQRDAHSWPEVYFPGIGWVEFEPTASQPDILRSSGLSDEKDSTLPPLDGPGVETILREMEEEEPVLREPPQISPIDEKDAFKIPEIIFWLLGLALVLTAFVVVYHSQSKFSFLPLSILVEKLFLQVGLRPPVVISKWAFQANLPPLFKAYHEINKALIRLGKKPLETQTPAERAGLLAEIVSEAYQPAITLIHEYEKEIFGGLPADLLKANYSAREIRHLSILATIKINIQHFTNKIKIFHKFKHDVESHL